MKIKTLQEQYNLITKGKGNKSTFLKESKSQFPNMISNISSFEETTKILKNRGVISENYIDLQPINTMEATPKEKWENMYVKFLAEEAKVEEKKTTKEVEDIQSHGFDYSDTKNLDNQIGQEVLNGIYFESKQNPDKDLEEIRKIVSKNLEKDGQYYLKNAAFGVEGLGYSETEVEEVSGKYKESGYSDKLKKVVAESLMGGYASPAIEVVEEEAKPDFADIDGDGDKEEPMKKAAKDKKAKKPKKETVDSKLAEIAKQGDVVKMEAQINFLDEIIEEKTSRLTTISEDENLSELMDKKKLKEMQKEVKLLEKRKAGMEKMYEKMCGKAYSKSEVIDEDISEEPSEEYMEVKLKAEDRVDAGEEIKDIVKDYPEFSEMLLQDLGLKYGI